MNEFIKYLSLLVCIIAITACSSNNDIISYTPQVIGNISEAKDTIEELTFTQHQLQGESMSVCYFTNSSFLTHVEGNKLRWMFKLPPITECSMNCFRS